MLNVSASRSSRTGVRKALDLIQNAYMRKYLPSVAKSIKYRDSVRAPSGEPQVAKRSPVLESRPSRGEGVAEPARLSAIVRSVREPGAVHFLRKSCRHDRGRSWNSAQRPIPPMQFRLLACRVEWIHGQAAGTPERLAHWCFRRVGSCLVLPAARAARGCNGAGGEHAFRAIGRSVD